MRDGGGEGDHDAHGLDDAAAVHGFEAVEGLDGLGFGGEPVALGDAGVEFGGLPGEEDEGEAGEGDGEPGVGGDVGSPAAPAQAGLGVGGLVQFGGERHAAYVDVAAEQGENGGDEGVGEEDAGGGDQAAGEADGADFADRDDEEGEEADGDGGGGDEEGAAGLAGSEEGGCGAIEAGGNGFAETADHEEGVVDAEAEAEHGGEVLDKDAEVKVMREEAGDGEGGGDGELAYGEGDERGDEAAESYQEEG